MGMTTAVWTTTGCVPEHVLCASFTTCSSVRAASRRRWCVRAFPASTATATSGTWCTVTSGCTYAKASAYSVRSSWHSEKFGRGSAYARACTGAATATAAHGSIVECSFRIFCRCRCVR
jgi:hypothetical protein